MLTIFKILFQINLLLPVKAQKSIYVHHYQVCHFAWVEDFTYQLELKENNTFYFTRKVWHTKPTPKDYNDFVTGSYTISNDILILNPSTTTNKFVKEKDSLLYLIKDKKLKLVDTLTNTILSTEFKESDHLILFDKNPKEVE